MAHAKRLAVGGAGGGRALTRGDGAEDAATLTPPPGQHERTQVS